MSKKRASKPKIMQPGCPIAISLRGCTCSPLANNYGAGVGGKYVIAPDCKLHRQLDASPAIGDNGEVAGHG